MIVAPFLWATVGGPRLSECEKAVAMSLHGEPASRKGVPRARNTRQSLFAEFLDLVLFLVRPPIFCSSRIPAIFLEAPLKPKGLQGPLPCRPAGSLSSHSEHSEDSWSGSGTACRQQNDANPLCGCLRDGAVSRDCLLLVRRRPGSEGGKREAEEPKESRSSLREDKASDVWDVLFNTNGEATTRAQPEDEELVIVH